MTGKVWNELRCSQQFIPSCQRDFQPLQKNGWKSKNSGKTPKMDGENHGLNPMNKWMIWGEFSHYFLETPRVLNPGRGHEEEDAVDGTGSLSTFHRPKSWQCTVLEVLLLDHIRFKEAESFRKNRFGIWWKVLMGTRTSSYKKKSEVSAGISMNSLKRPKHYWCRAQSWKSPTTRRIFCLIFRVVKR